MNLPRWSLALCLVSAGCTGLLSSGQPDSGSGGGLEDTGTDAGLSADAGTSSDAGGFDDASVRADGGPAPILDVFGVRELYPTARPPVWTSAHWTSSYTVSTIDDRDPTRLSGVRGTGVLTVQPTGILTFSGSQLRLYIYAPDAGPWTNVEVTTYYRRMQDSSVAYAGVVIGVRSGRDGHTTATPCDAHTYYARLRNDGTLDFAKELEHPEASAHDSLPRSTVWPSEVELPSNRWIGVKLVVKTQLDGGVALESYRDLTEGLDGGDWALLHHTTDEGTWAAVTTCPAYAPVGGSSAFRAAARRRGVDSQHRGDDG